MDVGLIQSVARVGDSVEIRLVTGDRFEGVLEELALDRLKLRQADGVPVAVALSTIAVTLPKPQGEAPAARQPLPGQLPPAPELPPVTPLDSSPSPDAVSPPDSQVQLEDPGARLPWSTERTHEEKTLALAAIAELPIIPIDLDIYVTPPYRRNIEQIRNSYSYAQKINELSPRYRRVHQLHSRALELWNADQDNPELTRVVGAFAVLRGDTDSGRSHLAAAAEAGDVAAFRLLSVTAAQLGDPETAEWALLNFFHKSAPSDDEPAWLALLMLLDAHGHRGRLAELSDCAGHDEAARAAVQAALGGSAPVIEPISRPAGATPRHRASQAGETAVAPPSPAHPRRTQASRPMQPPRFDGPYQRAKYLEHRLKDLTGAKAAFRDAIRKGDRRDSAVKDLAWLTKRTDGPDAALKILEEEWPNIVAAGDALDNIMIDFLTSAKRYPEALEALERQYRRVDLTSSRRFHLSHQIAYAKLAAGQDSTIEWEYLLEQSPDNVVSQRGLALALIQRGKPDDLARAEELVSEHTDDRAAEIRSQIEALRQGGEAGPSSTHWIEQLLGAPMSFESASPLVTYVMNNWAELAHRAREQAERQNRPVTIRDLNPIAEMARQMSGKQPSDSARGYISAAALARDLGEPEAQRYLCLGLTTLADIVLDKQENQSARDLYCAAMAAADERDDNDAERDLRSALIGYLRSLNGRRAAPTRRRDRDESAPLSDQVARVLSEEWRRHGDKVFGLIPPLIADTSLARSNVLEAIDSRTELLQASTVFLNDDQGGRMPADPLTVRQAWQVAGDRWSRSMRRLVQGLGELKHLTISEDVLASGLSRLRDHAEDAPESLREALGHINEALVELRRFANERSFEERENSLRQTANIIRTLRGDIEHGPTNLAVELAEPVALRISELVKDKQSELLATQPPQPGLALALDKSSAGQNGVVTVQIKVTNAPGMAPVESPQLTIEAERELFTVNNAIIPLPTAVRGGSSRIEAVKLRVTEAGVRAGAFSLPVQLHYRRRSSDQTMTFMATLPVRLARATEFEAITNPFQDGATGRPVVKKEMFYGRDDLIDSVRARFREATSPGVGVAIFGQKRAGKSSIRLHLTQRLEEIDSFTVVDIGNIGDLSPEPGDVTSTRLLALLMWRILEGASVAIERRPGTAPLIPEGMDRDKFLSSPEPIYDLARMVERHRGTAGAAEPPLVVIIDEFQYIDQWIRLGLLSSSFLQAFKALIERRLFHLVIVGQAALSRLMETDPNVFGVFFSERVTYLAEADARKLIEEPISIKAEAPITRYKEHAVDQILELTGGSAFYIQRFCSQLVEYMNAERSPLVTEADVEAVRDQFLNMLEARDFDNLESPGYLDDDAPSGNQYRQVLLAVARASRNQHASMQAVREQYRDGPRLEYLLNDLVLRDVVRRHAGAYYIVVRLYQDWLLKYFGTTAGAI